MMLSSAINKFTRGAGVDFIDLSTALLPQFDFFPPGGGEGGFEHCKDFLVNLAKF